ncbi:HNH endonuclease [Pseudomonas sp. GL-B-19]|uniref:HNH endonuclease n=1 Tax=Pseudomonas sp. GL-B-19 TaxID=2832393 RepID=UPI001CBA78F6|nr:HNH endonuclease [Pseudomonas sp. GL-B-19]
MSRFEFLEDVVGVNDDGTHCHPYKHTVRKQKGKFSYSFETHNKDFIPASAEELIALIEDGRFDENGKIRMLPPDSTNTKNNGAMRVAFYKGQKLPLTSQQSERSSREAAVQYWWVNHKQTYRSEIEGGYVWSPKANSNGARNQTYLNLTLVRPGDIVFSYAGAEIRAVGVVTAEHQEQPKPEEFGLTGGHWSADGWLVPVEWVVLDMPISPKFHLAAIAPLLPPKNSPLQSNGNGNQSCYLASVSVDLGELVLDLARQASPVSIDRIQELEDCSLEDVQQKAIELDQSISPTEREQLTKARVGQGLFRLRVQSIEKTCRLTGIADARFLVASHIKPWKSGDNNERLDGHNGLMLAPHVDKLFDRGWISFEDNGDVLVEQSAKVVTSSWGLSGVTNVGAFTREQQVFLRYHRAHVFKG